MKKIVIVGASSGIGQCLAMQYIADGNWMVGIAARRGDSLEKLRRSAPDRVVPQVMDVTADDAADRLADLVSKLGGMDVFLLSSGVGNQNPGLDAEIENRTIATNVKDGDSMFNNNAYLDSTVVMNDKCTFNLLRAAEEDLLPKT